MHTREVLLSQLRIWPKDPSQWRSKTDKLQNSSQVQTDKYLEGQEQMSRIFISQRSLADIALTVKAPLCKTSTEMQPHSQAVRRGLFSHGEPALPGVAVDICFKGAGICRPIFVLIPLNGPFLWVESSPLLRPMTRIKTKNVNYKI